MGDANRSEISANKRIAIVGTGPLSLLKAHFLSLKNPDAEITLFDSGSQIGGAWYSDFSPKGHLIECGCHIWSFTPEAYKFIEKELNVKLVDMTPSPVFIGRFFSLPYSLKNTIDTYRSFFKLLIRFDFQAIKTANTKPYTHYRIFGKKNKYPLTGSPELIHAIEKKIKSNQQIKVLLNTKITGLEIGSVVRLFEGENIFNFDKVFLTYVSHVQKIILPDQTVTGVPRQVNYIHFLIKSDKPLKKKLTYWRLMNDHVVHRITDISYQTNSEENLFLVGIKGDSFEGRTETQLMGHVKNLFTSKKLIDINQTFELIKTHIFPTYYMNPDLRKILAEYPERIESLPTTDLMYGLHYLLCDETPHLINAPK